MNQKKESLMKPVIILVAICLLTAAALALANELTKDAIAESLAAIDLQAKQEVFPEAEKFVEKTDKEISYYEGLNAAGEVIGYIFKNSHEGYGGQVYVNVGIDSEGKITGVKPVDLNETPGIGSKIGDEEFVKSYIGKSDKVYLSENPSEDYEVLAVTGATISSTAFVNSVNDSLSQFAELFGGPGNPFESDTTDGESSATGDEATQDPVDADSSDTTEKDD